MKTSLWHGTRLCLATATFCVLSAGASPVRALENGLERTPLMGWASWNQFGVNIDEKLIREIADAMVSSGLADLGYNYINIDDGWFGGRGTDGVLGVNTRRFPNGMKAVADYIHSKGLKAGIYTDAGRDTCGSIFNGDTLGTGSGSYEHRQQDFALMFTTWGYDFLKVDWCGGRKLALDPQKEYTAIKDAILATGRPVVYNVCNWEFPGEWIVAASNQWRIAYDINASFASVTKIIDAAAPLDAHAGPGHFNDMDMMEVGRGMSYDEDKTHFSMWAVMASPILLGNDLRKMSAQTLEILTNKEVIAISQDPAGLQAKRVRDDGDLEVWSKPLGSATSPNRAVALLNRGNGKADITVKWSEVGLSGSVPVRDVWAHKSLGPTADSYTASVPSHGVVVIRLGDDGLTPPPVDGGAPDGRDAGTVADAAGPAGADVVVRPSDAAVGAPDVATSRADAGGSSSPIGDANVAAPDLRKDDSATTTTTGTSSSGCNCALGHRRGGIVPVALLCVVGACLAWRRRRHGLGGPVK